MAYSKPTQIESWSASRYFTYDQCPALAKFRYLDKIKEPGSEAMDRGTDIHKMAELYIKGHGRTIPKELTKFTDYFKDLRKNYKKVNHMMFIEDTWSYRNDWSQTTYNDWSGCWLRVKLDCAYHDKELKTLYVDDFKTGKFRPEESSNYIMQLELYALAALKRYPHLEEVRPRLVYLDTGDIYPPADAPLVFKRADVPSLEKIWAKRIKPMLTDKRFLPKPNNKCRWCFFCKENNGPCKF